MLTEVNIPHICGVVSDCLKRNRCTCGGLGMSCQDKEGRFDFWQPPHRAVCMASQQLQTWLLDLSYYCTFLCCHTPRTGASGKLHCWSWCCWHMSSTKDAVVLTEDRHSYPHFRKMEFRDCKQVYSWPDNITGRYRAWNLGLGGSFAFCSSLCSKVLQTWSSCLNFCPSSSVTCSLTVLSVIQIELFLKLRWLFLCDNNIQFLLVLQDSWTQESIA